MSGKSDVLQWLLEHLEERCQTSYVKLNEIVEKIGQPPADIQHVIGKKIKKIFKNVTVKRQRSKLDWLQRDVIYYGISFENIERPIEITFSDISSISSDFFVVEKNENTVKLGHFMDIMMNSMNVFIEVKFNSDKTWSATACNSVLKPECIGMQNNQFELNSNSVSKILKSVLEIRVCEGVSLPSNHPSVSKASKEFFARDKENNKTTYRSVKCSIFLGIMSLSSTKSCSSCKALIKIINNENDKDDNVQRQQVKPLQDITNTSLQNSRSAGDEGVISLCEEDNKDLKNILGSLIKECPPKMVEFLKSQEQALSKSPYGNRWSKTIIRTCLTLWCRSPRAYADLKASGFVLLPSQRLLQTYKNKVHQKPGMNKELVHWMRNEAMLKNIPPEGYEGGLVLDEMSIQSDLQFYCKNGKYYLTGFTEISEESDLMEYIKSGKCELQLATHVLQFAFLGFTGFRFPLFHFPTIQASACDLFLQVWNTVDMLNTFGFIVKYISTDGAQTNRDLGQILMGQFTSMSTSMKIENIFSKTSQDMFFIMDYSHIMKKIRNNINKSGCGSNFKRHLYMNAHYINWNHLYSAHMWDISTNPFPIYQKLSHDHFFLTSEAKMRNHLAEDVLNKEMLHLMQCYADSMKESSYLSSTIDLLQHTSVLVENFRDPRPITSSADKRLEENVKVLNFFRNWEESVKGNKDIKEQEKCLISHQTRADLTSLIIGFDELCKSKLKKSSASIVPNRINSDVIENVFSQQRGLYNGSNTNPNYLTYCRTMNAVILGQPTVSRKSNAAPMNAGAHPFSS